MKPIKAAVICLLKDRIGTLSVEVSDLADTVDRYRDQPSIVAALAGRKAQLKEKIEQLKKLLADVEAHRCPKAERNQ